MLQCNVTCGSGAHAVDEGNKLSPLW